MSWIGKVSWKWGLLRIIGGTMVVEYILSNDWLAPKDYLVLQELDVTKGYGT